ncbi:universal stress protein [Plakobranchus ocellatus]|uniref:Universal stress protein n=1 Tax=Plakobranchus ocellatus TaxID=259542 RepID=A0AAV4DNE3_9GAST|nr:universal stress protein [Plakobranchus ocellatus]
MKGCAMSTMVLMPLRPTFNMRRHMVALDGKSQGDYAFEWYLNNVYRDGDEVVIVHCSPFTLNIGIPGAAVNVELVGKMVKEAKDKAEAITGHANETLRAKGYAVIKSGVKPEEGIIAAIGEEKVDHVFMGTRELGSLQRALVGSVSTFVVRHASVPVTIVKMPH